MLGLFMIEVKHLLHPSVINQRKSMAITIGPGISVHKLASHNLYT